MSCYPGKDLSLKSVRKDADLD